MIANVARRVHSNSEHDCLPQWRHDLASSCSAAGEAWPDAPEFMLGQPKGDAGIMPTACCSAHLLALLSRRLVWHKTLSRRRRLRDRCRLSLLVRHPRRSCRCGCLILCGSSLVTALRPAAGLRLGRSAPVIVLQCTSKMTGDQLHEMTRHGWTRCPCVKYASQQWNKNWQPSIASQVTANTCHLILHNGIDYIL